MAFWMLDFGHWTLEGEKTMSYEKLEVYQLSYSTALKIHRLTMMFPKHETYEIGGQLRRASVSIVLNIAEGYGRKEHQQDFKNFLINALGSCNEATVLIKLSTDLGYISPEVSKELFAEYEQLGKQLNKFIAVINNPKSNV